MVALALGASTAIGATIKVPSDAPTIQAGIDRAKPGDRVLVAPGTYAERIYIHTSGIQVQGAGANLSVINPSPASSGRARVVTFLNRGSPDSVLEGFTLTGGNDSRGAEIFTSYAAATIRKCTISKNLAQYGSGGGVYFYGRSSSPTITDCTISENRADFLAGGIMCASCSPTISNCTVSENTAAGNFLDGGGGIFCAGDAVITNCVITGNHTNDAGGGIMADSSSPTITNCTISNNSADTAGGGIWSFNALERFTISNCTITDNIAGSHAGGIDCEFSSPNITNCTIARNVSKSGAGGIHYWGASPTLTHCTLSENTTQERGGGVQCRDESAPTIRNCIRWGNSPDEVYSAPQWTGGAALSYCDVQGG